MGEKRSPEERLAVALNAIVSDRGIRRYLALHDPEALHQAQRALEAFDRVHVAGAHSAA